MPPNPLKNLREAVDLLLTSLNAEDLDRLGAMREDDLISLHLGMGMWMRNSFPIWGNGELLRSIAMESRPRVAAEMEKLLAETQQDSDQAERIRKLFDRALGGSRLNPTMPRRSSSTKPGSSCNDRNQSRDDRPSACYTVPDRGSVNRREEGHNTGRVRKEICPEILSPALVTLSSRVPFAQAVRKGETLNESRLMRTTLPALSVPKNRVALRGTKAGSLHCRLSNSAAQAPTGGPPITVRSGRLTCSTIRSKRSRSTGNTSSPGRSTAGESHRDSASSISTSTCPRLEVARRRDSGSRR